jgi:DNA-binding phage protein
MKHFLELNDATSARKLARPAVAAHFLNTCVREGDPELVFLGLQMILKAKSSARARDLKSTLLKLGIRLKN